MTQTEPNPQIDAAVYVVDDDAGARTATLFLVESLGRHGRGYASGADLMSDIQDLPPGCILTDFRMPGLSGLELIDELRRLGRQDPVIVMTGFADVALAIQTFRSGAVDLLEKPFPIQDLQRSLDKGAAKLRDQMEADARQRAASERLERLAPREREVAKAMAEGKPSKVIARELGISPRTVDAYRANIHTKTGCASVAEVVALFIAEGSQRAIP